MALFDALKNQVTSQLKREESFTFTSLPTRVAELKALPEASLDSAFKTTALCIAVLCHLEKDANATWEMLDFLKYFIGATFIELLGGLLIIVKFVFSHETSDMLKHLTYVDPTSKEQK